MLQSPDTPPLFVYGTLRDAELFATVVGRVPEPHVVHPAVAPGFRAVAYPGRIYPALIRAPGGRAEGLVLLGLSPFERDLLDLYEGEEYRRGPIAVMIGEELYEVDAYLPVIAIAPPAHDWSLSRWQANHKPGVIVAEAATAFELRARLIAMRPH